MAADLSVEPHPRLFPVAEQPHTRQARSYSSSLDQLVEALDGEPDDHQLRIGTRLVSTVGELRRLADDLGRGDRCSHCGRHSTLDTKPVDGTEQTSRDAAATVNAGSQRARVLAIIGRRQLTADAVAAVLDRSPNLVATRLMELRDSGHVEYVVDEHGTRARAETRTGRKAYVQQLTNHGVATLAAL